MATDTPSTSVEENQEQLATWFIALCGEPDDAEAAARADQALHALDTLLAADAQ
ncbi:hypothetical protein [Streptomyces alanosinicus]|uniref:Uncharacterized protein n=1 Tax=Streptomyces alanosinicus TaxID=68171 RepID=A0A918YSW0_9ACTN|nr:hypothetical protein [Streptomyces alanosinicus]GHE15578.1 hypothetical protein GCM10010339_90670 [Streptomyces alanosinicus]